VTCERLIGFESDQPDRIWVTDLTYIPTDAGWLYLASVPFRLLECMVGIRWDSSTRRPAELADV
jgi:putative transposase